MLEITLFISHACLMSGKPILKYCLKFLSRNFRLVKVRSTFRNTFGFSLLGPRRKQESYIFSIFSLAHAVSLLPLREEDRVRFVAEKCALRQGFLRIRRLYAVIIIQSMLHVLDLTKKTNQRRRGT